MHEAVALRGIKPPEDETRSNSGSTALEPPALRQSRADASAIPEFPTITHTDEFIRPLYLIPAPRKEKIFPSEKDRMVGWMILMGPRGRVQSGRHEIVLAVW